MTDKKKNRKVISPLKVPLENETKIKPSTEGNNFKYLVGNYNYFNKHNFNTAFAIAHVIKHHNKFYVEDRNSELQFA